MTQREGNLDAPTRHPIDWKGAAYYDQAACETEMARIFDICHGCRRCVSLCHSFPTLFDLVDATKEGEVHEVAKPDFWKVVDQCYLCDLCYMTKCPYVPPHPWNVDFPHTMLRAKAIKFKNGGVGAGERFLASTDKHGKFAGIHPDAWLPDLATSRFRWSAKKTGSATEVRDGQRTPGKVAIFSTCYINYNEPGIGHDLIKLLEHNEIPYTLVEKEKCCGMPKLELGDLDSVARHKEANMPVLAKYAKDGFAILSAVPSCTLMFKQELPLMFPDDADTQLVKEAMYDPFEYFVARNRDGLLKTDFKHDLGKVSYHIPCHGRVQNIGKKTEEMLKLIGKTVTLQLNTVERCSGHAGTYGVKTPTHPIALKIGRPVFKAMAKDEPDVISSDCALAGHHIAQGMQVNGLPAVPLQHPLSLVCKAYGI